LTFVFETLLNNNYLIDFIFNTINDRLKSLLSNKILKQNTNDTFNKDIVKKSWFTIPFVSEISYKFKDIIKNLDVDLVFFSLNSLILLLKHKDLLLNKTKKNIIHKIYYKDCDPPMSGRQGELKKRESQNIVMTSEETRIIILLLPNRLDLNHDFDWEGTEIVDQERFLYKQRISEMLHIQFIKKQS